MVNLNTRWYKRIYKEDGEITVNIHYVKRVKQNNGMNYHLGRSKGIVCTGFTKLLETMQRIVESCSHPLKELEVLDYRMGYISWTNNCRVFLREVVTYFKGRTFKL